MSRHSVKGFEPSLEIAIGFDAPLNTYFAQVTKPTTDDFALDEQAESDDQILLWIGTNWKEVLDLKIIVERLAPFAALTPELLAQLENDRRREERQPSALQNEMRLLFENLNRAAQR